MNRTKLFSAVLAAAFASTGCSIFEDPTPETISVQLTGSAGTTVLAIYSQVFVAGVNRETDITEVRLSGADSVMQTLPIDTIVDIAASRQFFLQIETMPGDTADVRVQIDVDSRNVVNSSGLIFPGLPWRYVYQFNRPLTDVVEVVF
ncbi:MAG: hypothetical protein HKN72_15470 [Gemmatimonadetes bacterium]|nr:hypothetical protein [Gemmatimonadota bacterium]